MVGHKRGILLMLRGERYSVQKILWAGALAHKARHKVTWGLVLRGA